MNPVERALHQELTGLLDRLATSLPEGGFDSIRAANPTLKARLDDTDARLAAARESLLDGYGPVAPRAGGSRKSLGAGGLAVNRGRRAGRAIRGARRLS